MEPPPGGTLRPSDPPARGGTRRPRSSESRRSRGSSVPSSRVSRPPQTPGVADPLADSQRQQRCRDEGSLPQAGRLALTGLVGYAGYIPGKVARNIYGSTFQVTNERAAREVDMTRSGRVPEQPGRTLGPHPGTTVPGYMGFVPGRHADNVVGQTCARGAETAWMIKAQQAQERQQRYEAYRRGERPPTGTVNHAGYRPLGAIGVDSTA
mmetsp:Transcript_21710/g.65260  ORF Transcript_21710/g.65260 Transcript_21710/m.65260 type:complete len:209 (-) Transcript_21710:72-698(-)